MIDAEFKSEVVAGARTGIAKLRAIIDSIDTSKFVVDDPKQVMNLCNSYAGLTKSYCDLMRESRERSNLLQEVADTMKQEIRGLMESRPDLIEACQAVIDEGLQLQLLKDEGKDNTMDNMEDATVGQRYRVRIKNERKKNANTKLITK